MVAARKSFIVIDVVLFGSSVLFEMFEKLNCETKELIRRKETSEEPNSTRSVKTCCSNGRFYSRVIRCGSNGRFYSGVTKPIVGRIN